MSGDPLTPAEAASMKPYERQQGGWWEYGTDPYGADKVWRPALDPLQDPEGRALVQAIHDRKATQE